MRVKNLVTGVYKTVPMLYNLSMTTRTDTDTVTLTWTNRYALTDVLVQVGNAQGLRRLQQTPPGTVIKLRDFV